MHVEDKHLTFLLAIRKEKWNQINNIERADLTIISGYLGFLTVGGSLFAWLAKSPDTFAKIDFTLIFAMLDLLSLFGISSLLRNYIKHLRALKTINLIEELTVPILPSYIPEGIAFEEPKTLKKFLSKFLFCTRGAMLLILLSFPVCLAYSSRGHTNLSHLSIVVSSILLAGIGCLLSVKHFRSYHRRAAAASQAPREVPGAAAPPAMR